MFRWLNLGQLQVVFANNSLILFRIRILIAIRAVFIRNHQSTISRWKKRVLQCHFTLGPDAVTKKVLHALNSSSPKSRYYVTFPTYLFAYLKRLLYRQHS